MKSTQLIFLASLLLTASSEPIKVPLYRKRNNFISASAKALKNGMLGGQVQIGNPPQNFTLAFDTTTGFTWVRGVECMGENCLNRTAYDPNNSTSSIHTEHEFTMKYGPSTVSSTIVLDTFRFSGITVRELPFGNAYCMVGFNQGFDGFIGLGRSVDLNTNRTIYAKREIPASGFVPSAYQQGSGVGSSQFGMYTTSGGPGFSQDVSRTSNTNSTSVIAPTNGAITGSNNGGNSGSSKPAGASTGIASGGWGTFSKRTYDEPAGYLILGGIDKNAIQGSLYYVKVSEENGSGNWAVPVYQAKFIHDLHFNVKKHARAILSTSTDVIGLPNKQADEFKKRWYAVYDEPDNTYMIPCCLMNKLTSFQIQLGSLTVTLPSHYWSYPQETETCCEMCRTHIGRSDSDSDYVLGYSFTNAFYTQFDDAQDRIGLAIKKHHVHDGLELCQK